MPMPSARASTGERDGDRAALPARSRRRRLDDPVEDLHQGGLARAVLAEERMDFARADRQIDGVIGQEFAVALADSPQLDEGLVRMMKVCLHAMELWVKRLKTGVAREDLAASGWK